MERADLKAKLKEYMEIPRLSGYESLMAERFSEDMKKYTDSVETDKLGNVIPLFPYQPASAHDRISCRTRRDNTCHPRFLP